MESFPDMLVRRINDSRSASNPSGRLGNVQLGNDVERFLHTIPRGSSRRRTQLDMAISNCDTAFFTVAVPGGNGEYTEYYTRDGSFALNAYGQLVTKEGYLVMAKTVSLP